MAENETLCPSAKSASRWRPLKDRLAGGESPGAIFPELRRQLFLALRRVFKQWKARGVDPKQLFEAASNDPAALRDLVNRTRNDEHARLLQDSAAGEPNRSLKGVISSFLDSVWDHVRDHLQIDCREGGVPDTFLDDVEQMLRQLSNGLLKNPSRVPRLPPKNESPPDINDMLGESLPLA